MEETVESWWSTLQTSVHPHVEHAGVFIHQVGVGAGALLSDTKERLLQASQFGSVGVGAQLSDESRERNQASQFLQEAIIRIQQDDFLLDNILFGSASLLLLLLAVWVYRRQGMTLEPSRRRSSQEEMDDLVYQSTKETTEEIEKLVDALDVSLDFFPLSPKLCKRVKISVPQGMVIKSSRVWDIEVINVKQRGPMVFYKKQRKPSRVALEIVGPANKKTVDLSTAKRFVVSLRNLGEEDDDNEEDDDDEEGACLADDEYVNVRIYRPRKDSGKVLDTRILHSLFAKPTTTNKELMSDASVRTLASQSSDPRMLPVPPEEGEEDCSDDDDDDDWDDELFYNKEGGPTILFPPDHMEEWISHKTYPGYDSEARKSHGKVMEVKLGSGLVSVVRELVFQSTQERESFQELCTKLVRLHDNRNRRQLKRYRQDREEQYAAQQHQPTDDAIGQSASSNSNNNHQADDETIRLLIEIVSATNLPTGQFNKVDPYVVVRMGNRVIHKTNVLVQTKNPIWTIKTGSLCLLCAAPEDIVQLGTLKFSLMDFNTLANDQLIGAVYFSLSKLLACQGDRVGYDVNLVDRDNDSSDPMSSHNEPRLFLRIREATTSDVQFMRDLESNFGKNGVYSGETVLPMRPPQSTFLKFQQKEGEEKHDVLHRVRPYPDPDREDETTWLTSDDLYRESMMSSVNWVEAGSGDLGQLYVEVLGCSNLPNMDRAILGRKTDAFASIVFEDSAITTDVIGQCLSPRWMPWSRRAFVFNIENPSSCLFIGVFDHDPEPFTSLEFMSRLVHDPIGRVEVHVSNMSPDTVYTLAYPLYFSDDVEERDKKEKGKLWIRVRKTWKDFKKAMLAGTAPPPLMVVSMTRPIDYRVVRYTAVGPRDDTGFNIWKFTEYIEELQAYGYLMEYVKDFAFNTWLWRGHYKVKIGGSKFLLPLHSLTAFFWGVVVTNDFNKFPSFFLFSIGWLLLACNEAVNKNPSPWHKCPAYYRHMHSFLRSKKSTGPVAIAPYQQLRQVSNFEKARKKREKWKEKERELLDEQQKKMELTVEGFNGENFNSVLDITTGSRADSLLMRFLFPLKPVLYPIQKQLRQVVISCRVSTSILLWEESQLAFWITTASFVGSVVLYKIPFSFLIRWTLRISAWVFLGPWMLLADRWYFQDSKQDVITDEERDERIRVELRRQYETFMDEALNYQIQKENIVKLESMKSYMFGSYHIRVPRFRERRFKDTPLPESFAEPFNNEDAEPTIITERKYGQRLSGDMIPKTEFEAYSAREDFEQRRRQPVLSLFAEQMQALAPSRLLIKTRDVLQGAPTSKTNTSKSRLNPNRGNSKSKVPTMPAEKPEAVNPNRASF